MDRGPSDIEPLQFGISGQCELGDHAGTHHIERAMVLCCAESRLEGDLGI
jgi:hypothetical protein